MIQIFVDSGANLSPELREQYNIHLLPMALTIDDQPAPEGLDGHEYYEALRSGADVRTSMVNPDDARKAFEHPGRHGGGLRGGLHPDDQGLRWLRHRKA